MLQEFLENWLAQTLLFLSFLPSQKDIPTLSESEKAVVQLILSSVFNVAAGKCTLDICRYYYHRRKLALAVCVWRGFQQFCYLHRAIEFKDILGGIVIASEATRAAHTAYWDVAAAEGNVAKANRVVAEFPAVGRFLVAAEFHQQQMRNERAEVCEHARGVRYFADLQGEVDADEDEGFVDE
ncbi:MAG: hypothetical protein Q9160_008574 [Pyrenula sp. 1 TL-2023]